MKTMAEQQALGIFRASMPPSRRADYQFGIFEGSIFIDFNLFFLNFVHIYIVFYRFFKLFIINLLQFWILKVIFNGLRYVFGLFELLFSFFQASFKCLNILLMLFYGAIAC